MNSDILKLILLSIVGYLIGSLSSSVIITKLVSGRDIRNIEIKNAGAYNVFRNIGKGWGCVVAALDGLKGLFLICIGFLLKMQIPHIIIAASFVVIGHCFPIFYHFYGGRGGATTIGVLVPFLPIELVIWLVPAIILGLLIKRPGYFPVFWMFFVLMTMLLFNWSHRSQDTVHALLYVMILTGVLNTVIILSHRDSRVVKE
ncbi:MAG: glycerol-3-phosphate acyltransferase [Candidatus Cloacimonetes bacterium]|nr:glycerol-3-phosphate acyltransferase [Candidatus Cloacimonadota bacterium]